MSVHKEPIDFIDIPAPQHSKDAFYRVCYGEVEWNENESTEEAIYTIMIYGSRPNYRRVAHILTTANGENELTDFDKVLAAMNKLKTKYNL